MVVGSNPVAVTSPPDFAPASSKEFLDIQATIECGFTLKRVRDMIITYSQNNFNKDLLPDATMATTIDVVVEELCNNTVATTPIISPATGFVTILFDENASPRHHSKKNSLAVDAKTSQCKGIFKKLPAKF